MKEIAYLKNISIQSITVYIVKTISTFFVSHIALPPAIIPKNYVCQLILKNLISKCTELIIKGQSLAGSEKYKRFFCHVFGTFKLD